MRSFTFWTEHGDAVLHAGSRLEWDSIAGIGIHGAGTCIGIGQSLRGEPPAVGIWIDPNEHLHAWAAEVRASTSNWNRDLRDLVDTKGRPTGLNGTGGCLVMAGYEFDHGVRGGSIRILNEIRDPATYLSTVNQWRADAATDLESILAAIGNEWRLATR
jgi:hypothetical protein